MTREKALKIVSRLNAMTKKDLPRAICENKEFSCLHRQLLSNGWGTLTDRLERLDDGTIVGTLRLVRQDDPEWKEIPS